MNVAAMMPAMMWKTVWVEWAKASWTSWTIACGWPLPLPPLGEVPNELATLWATLAGTPALVNAPATLASLRLMRTAPMIASPSEAPKLREVWVMPVTSL